MEIPSTFSSQSVKKHSTRLIVGAMIIALLGLIIVQLHWINNAVDLSDAVFTQQVNEALDNVAHKAERLEAIRDGMQIVSSMQSLDNHSGVEATSQQLKSQFPQTLAHNIIKNTGQNNTTSIQSGDVSQASTHPNRRDDSMLIVTTRPNVSLKSNTESTTTRQRINTPRQQRRTAKETTQTPVLANPNDEISDVFNPSVSESGFASVSSPSLNQDESPQLSINIRTTSQEISSISTNDIEPASSQAEEPSTRQQNDVIVSRQPLRRAQSKARVWDSVHSLILGKSLTLNFNQVQQQMNCAVDQLRNQQFVIYRRQNGSTGKSSGNGVSSASAGSNQPNQGALISIKDNGTLMISAPPITSRSNRSVSSLNLIVTDDKSERVVERQQPQSTYSVAGGSSKNQQANLVTFSSGGSTTTISSSSYNSRSYSDGTKNPAERTLIFSKQSSPTPPTPPTPPALPTLQRLGTSSISPTLPSTSVASTTIGEHYSMLKQEREEASSAKTLRSMNEQELQVQMEKSKAQEALVCTDRVAMKIRSIQETMSELGEFTTTLEQRINNHILDSMIASEFSSKKLPLDYEFAVENGQFKTISFAKNSASTNQFDVFRDSPYSTVLFPNDILQRNHKLYVMFPNKTSYLAGTNLSVILYSALFVVMIVGCFGWTLNNLNKHKAVSAMKSDFINNMTHELKTPIATIGLAAEALRDPDITASKDRVHRFVTVIKDENTRLGTQVERVLQAARLERGEIALSKTEFDVHECISSVVESLALQIGANGGEIITDFRAENSIIVADEMHITNSLLNLLDNAMKYTDTTPSIKITTLNDGNSMIIRVKDNGIGISKEHQQKVFDKLYRVPTGNIHNVKGFGLGLSYVKAIADAHHGEVAVESAPKTGSMFEITLPIQGC
jgi:two-component system, OmpR family, phosphate regulon sensor histidine kinase PhoR